MTKRLFSKLACGALAIAMTLAGAAGFAGCNRTGTAPGGIDQEVDPTRTQLYVANHDGGFGHEWVQAAARRFEELYKDVPFEEGKTGVQIMFDRTGGIGSQIMAKIPLSRNAVYFTESVYYYDYLNAQNGAVFADITDIVSGEDSDLSEFGDTGTIEDKLTDQQKEFYQTDDGKYYGIPHYQAFQGIIYDKDFFEQDMLYFSDNENNGNGGFITSRTEKRSPGKDGIYCETCAANGYDYSDHYCDDGLPATYDEFARLLEYIADSGETPLIWSGQVHQNYLDKFMSSLAADYEGLDDFMLNYTFKGTAHHLVQGIDANTGEVTLRGATEIMPKNGYEMYTSAGRYYAMEFMQEAVSDSRYYYYLSFNGTHSHTNAQDDFLRSKDRSSRIAMLIDGSYWENEADDTFEYMSNNNVNDPDSRYSRKFGFMPLPKPTEEDGTENTLFDFLYSLGFINANIEDDPVLFPLAKKFLKFVNTEQSLREFTVITGSPKALEYDLTEDDLSRMSFYGRSLWNLKANSDVVYPYSTGAIFLNNQSDFVFANSFADSGVSDVSKTLRDGASTPLQLFNNIGNTKSQAAWNSNYSNYFS